MTALTDGRGVLYPAKLPTFRRSPAPDQLADRIRWFWIPQWDLAPGRTSRQELLPFPASNLVVAPEGVSLAGPTTGASHRDLQGRGWAVGALLRPAALGVLTDDPRSIRDRELRYDAPALQRAVAIPMTGRASADVDAAVAAFVAWASVELPAADETGQLANAMENVIAEDRGIVRVEQVADRLGMSIRGVQRLAARYVGLTPLAIIRRYRLQEAAQRLREDPALTISQVAADLGYADHAHLSADFRRVLGFAPRSYRPTP